MRVCDGCEERSYRLIGRNISSASSLRSSSLRILAANTVRSTLAGLVHPVLCVAWDTIKEFGGEASFRKAFALQQGGGGDAPNSEQQQAGQGHNGTSPPVGVNLRSLFDASKSPPIAMSQMRSRAQEPRADVLQHMFDNPLEVSLGTILPYVMSLLLTPLSRRSAEDLTQMSSSPT